MNAEPIPWSRFTTEVVVCKAWLSAHYAASKTHTENAGELKGLCERTAGWGYVSAEAITVAALGLGFRVRHGPAGQPWASRVYVKRRTGQVMP